LVIIIDMRKTVFIFFVALSALFIVIRLSSKHISDFLESSSRAGIRVESNPAGEVFIDSQAGGKTPYQKEDLKKGDHLVEIKGDSALSWQGYVKLNPGTLTVVNRELSKSSTEASGEIITLEKGEGVSIISSPSGAEVSIDGIIKGKTPTLVDITPGEHQFVLTKGNFLTRSIRSVVTAGFRLNLAVDLAVSEIDLTQIPTDPISSNSSVKVLDTPTGFLRVRSKANQSSVEISRVAPGDVLTLLDEVPNWKKVKLSDGKEGYVSAQYVEKLP